MTDNLFAGMASDAESPDIDATGWFKEPVCYENLIVTRSTAFQLCAEETRSWAQMDAINDLEKVELMPGVEVMDAATAYSHRYMRYNYPIVSRDI